MRWISSFALVLLASVGTNAEECTYETATVRKEWGSLDPAQRTDYINAVWCLRDKPAVLPVEEFPGVRDRFDDFVATHINYTNVIHANALLLPWHRHYIFLWEKTLQEECGYTGGVPYWDWTQSVGDISNSPVFDGSETSLSGDGDGDVIADGAGARCVTTGPFKGFQVHMGPFDNTEAGSYMTPPAHSFDYNPRCLSRNFTTDLFDLYNNETVVDGMLNAKDLLSLLTLMDPGQPLAPGAHPIGHRSLGGSMQDLYSSPQEPGFMLHHAMMDRMWSLWELRDMETRKGALNGTSVMYNPAEAPLATLDTVTEFGVLDRPKTIRELMDPMANGYCYRYE